MATPVVGVEIDFSNGASFGYPFILDDIDYGILGTNILADAAADIVNVTDRVMSVSTRRGRNRILSNFEAGTATVTLNDPNSDFNPQNTSSPYYGKLLPLRKIRIWADTTILGQTFRIAIFSGYINSFDTSFYQGVDSTSTVTLQCTDGFRLLNNVSTNTAPVPGCTAGQLSGARVNSLLDFSGFPNSLRSIDVGNSTMQVDPGGERSILAAIQTIEQSEFGAFYMSRQGEAKFLDRTTVSELADSTVRNYTDINPGAVDLTYTNLDFAFDDQLILNDVTVTRVGGTAQNAVSAESIATYFRKSGQRSDILVETNAESLDQAETILAARKNSDIRIDAMTLNLSTGTEFEALVNVSMDIYTLIKITKSMPGGSSITRELFVQGVQHDIRPGTWKTRLLTAEPIIQAFILDSPEQGILGLTDPPNTNALSY
jgi:hypothetical protein